jgi:hypothetical protein
MKPLYLVASRFLHALAHTARTQRFQQFHTVQSNPRWVHNACSLSAGHGAESTGEGKEGGGVGQRRGGGWEVIRSGTNSTCSTRAKRAVCARARDSRAVCARCPACVRGAAGGGNGEVGQRRSGGGAVCALCEWCVSNVIVCVHALVYCTQCVGWWVCGLEGRQATSHERFSPACTPTPPNTAPSIATRARTRAGVAPAAAVVTPTAAPPVSGGRVGAATATTVATGVALACTCTTHQPQPRAPC